MTETPIDKATVRLLSGKFAAFHTICDGCEIPVHRMIISRGVPSVSTSLYWQAYGEQYLIASNSQLAHSSGFSTSRVEILDTDIETMSRTPLFLYTGDYNDDSAPFLGKGTSSLPSNGNHSEVVDDSTLLEALYTNHALLRHRPILHRRRAVPKR
jgi:hypothetical protein